MPSMLCKTICNPFLEEFTQINSNIYSPGHYEKRLELVTKYSWAVPDEEAISTICQYSPVIEIGAGKGYWASLISQMGGEIVAFDYAANKKITTFFQGEKFYPVRYGNTKTVKRYPNHTLFLCWPPYNTPMAYETLKNYGGEILIYVGEKHGCTGCKRFGKEISTKWEEINSVDIPKWSYIHDRLYVYRRRK